MFGEETISVAHEKPCLSCHAFLQDKLDEALHSHSAQRLSSFMLLGTSWRSNSLSQAGSVEVCGL